MTVPRLDANGDAELAQNGEPGRLEIDRHCRRRRRGRRLSRDDRRRLVPIRAQAQAACSRNAAVDHARERGQRRAVDDTVLERLPVERERTLAAQEHEIGRIRLAGGGVHGRARGLVGEPRDRAASDRVGRVIRRPDGRVRGLVRARLPGDVPIEP
jgi:hypothetical protein